MTVVEPDLRPPALLGTFGASLVLAVGGRLLCWANPFDDPQEAPPRWTSAPRSAADPVIALSGCRRPANTADRPDLLFAAAASGEWEAWRLHAVSGPDGPQWSRHPVTPPPAPVRAVTGWALPGAAPEVVLADRTGRLSRLDLSAPDRPWEPIGRAPGVAALDALVRTDGTVELYALTADGEVTRRVRGAGQPGWGGVTTVASWVDPVLAMTSWPFAGPGGQPTEDQAVLLGPGTVQQRWRRDGEPEWSPWWPAPALAEPTDVTGLASARCADQQLLAVLYGAEPTRIAIRRWQPAGGWRSWEQPVPITPTLPTQAVSPPPPEPTTARTPEHEPDVDPTVPRRPQTRPAAEAATVLFTGRTLQELGPDDPRELGPFLVQRRIPGGQGGTDKYIARDGRGYCFLKVLRPDASEPEVQAFVRETENARRVVDRLRLATYIDHRPAGPDGPAYLALSYVPGQHLGDVIDRAPLRGTTLVGFAWSLLEALVELADCRLIHLDLKPANIILRDGHHPMIVDFGSAVGDHLQVVTQAFATPGYAPPELAATGAVNAGTDLYAWGAVVVSAATGVPPDPDPAARAAQLDRLPAKLRAVVADALATEPADRPTLADAKRRLASASGPLDDLVHDRLGVQSDGRQILPPRVRSAPRRLVQRAADLSPARYRAAAGVAALAGIVLGLVLGTFLITFLRGA